MQLSYLLIFSLVVLFSGSTTTTGQRCSGIVTATYDNNQAQTPAAVLGTYEGLKYNGFKLLNLGVLGSPPSTGVMPASNPNVVGFGLSELASTPNVTIIGGGSAGYNRFTAYSIAYGCIVGSVETVVNVPASCTLRFVGYITGMRLTPQVVTYEVANGQLTKAMSVVNLRSDVVDSMRIELVTPSQAAVTVVLDDFVYQACTL